MVLHVSIVSPFSKFFKDIFIDFLASVSIGQDFEPNLYFYPLKSASILKFAFNTTNIYLLLVFCKKRFLVLWFQILVIVNGTKSGIKRFFDKKVL